ncbi:hypothetical protein D3C87_1932300 [compost metagenome]
MQALHEFLRSFRVLDFRAHYPLGTHVEHAVNALAFRTFHAYNRGRGRVFERLQLVKHVLFGAGAMFQVDEHPVEPGQSDDLGGEGAACIEPAAVQGFPVLQSFFQVFHSKIG